MRDAGGSDSNKAKFSDHETRSDHSFPIRRSRANQGWLVFKSPEEVSCLDYFQSHHVRISIFSTPSVPSSLDCFHTFRAVVHFVHLRVFRTLRAPITCSHGRSSSLSGLI